MKRIAIIGGIIAAVVVATLVVAQGPDSDARDDAREAAGNDVRRDPGPPRGPGDPPGPGGHPGPGDGPGPRHGPRLRHVERAYAQEVRKAHKEIGELRQQLEQKYARLREIWGMRDQDLSEEEEAALRKEFHEILDESTETEIKIAKRQVELAEKALEIALDRLVQAKVELHEARIKKHRRDAWMRGGWGKGPPGERMKRLRDFRDDRRNGQQPDQESQPDEEQNEDDSPQ